MKLNSTRLRAKLTHALKGFVLSVTTLGLLAGLATPILAAPGDPIVVRWDGGGMIGQRNSEIRNLRERGQRVELRGICLSACTMYLSLPNVCVAPSATLGFHGPTRGGKSLPEDEFEHWSKMMAKNYREPLRSWYMSEARYRTNGYFEIGGKQIIAMGYPSC